MAQTVKSVDELTGKVRYPVKAINVLKAHGKGTRESTLLNGYAINMSRAAQVRRAGRHREGRRRCAGRAGSSLLSRPVRFSTLHVRVSG